MTGLVRIHRDGAVGLVALEHPPVNAPSHALRLAPLEVVEDLDRDARVGAIVIISTGAHFAAGADLAEFVEGTRAPLLADVLSRIESCREPVMAAMHRAALGGGAELALACHYRRAGSDLSFGFPEIQLGLIPAAGGTFRLPRLVGTNAAIRLITSGRRLSRAEAIAAGLVDHPLEGECTAAALEWARCLLAIRAPVRRTAGAAGGPLHVGYRRHLVQWLWIPARAWWPDVPRDDARLASRATPSSRLRGGAGRRVLATAALARAPRGGVAVRRYSPSRMPLSASKRWICAARTGRTSPARICIREIGGALVSAAGISRAST